MILRTKLLKSTFTPYVAVFLIVTVSIFNSLPSKSCEKQDSISIEANELKLPESMPRCEKDKVKEEKEKFNMMSLNLVYYLMNKFIDSSMPKE